MSTHPNVFLTPAQYLEIERKAEYKSEYLRGEMFAMSGASRAHNLIVGNFVGELRQKLRHEPCEVYPSDMRVFVKATGLYTYPDVVAVCGEPQFADAHLDTLLNPGFLVEVLSPSTEAYDRGRKSENYRSIPSLNEYLLVASDRAHIDQYIRQADGRWILVSLDGLDPDGPQQALQLQSLGCTLALSDIYEKVAL